MEEEKVARYIRKRVDVVSGDVLDILSKTKHFVYQGLDEIDESQYDIYKGTDLYIRDEENNFNIQLGQIESEDLSSNYNVLKESIKMIVENYNYIIEADDKNFSKPDKIIDLLEKIYTYTPELFARQTMTINGMENKLKVEIELGKIRIDVSSIFTNDKEISISIMINM